MITQSTDPSRLAAQAPTLRLDELYDHPETRALVALVTDAAKLVRSQGEAAFSEFRVAESRWRHGDTYVFVLDPEGNMVVHGDPAMEGTHQHDLADVSGKPIIQGLIAAATRIPGRPGWYHYQWPLPGGIFPRWKSSYVEAVQAPSGQHYIVGSGMYDDRMERAFVLDLVTSAVALIEQRGEAAFAAFHDPTGPFIAKDAYIFVMDLAGIELVNPAFPNLQGRNLHDLRDTQGMYVIREMIQIVERHGAGWVDYMWPKPGDSVSTQKSTYVSRARLGDRTVLVGCGVYLAEAPVEARPKPRLSAPALMALVREGAALLAHEGETAYAEFRQPGRWYRDSTYFFVLGLDGTTIFHAAEPAREGERDGGVDILGRPFRRMIVDVARSTAGEGWVHYMWPEPDTIFPAWKSTFVKRVTLPSGESRILCCGIYNMQLDRAFIEDVVDRAATLIEEHGRAAFDQLRDRTGPFVFMDTYVFVTHPDGTELVNPAQPRLEGRNLRAPADLTGRLVIAEEIALALDEGSGWLDVHWFRPGDNTPARKETYVRKVQSGLDTFIVGSGIYV